MEIGREVAIPYTISRDVACSAAGCAGRSGLPSVMSGATHTLKRLSFGTSRRATKMIVQGARERMFCHVAPIRLPCSRSLACCPVDLICRCEEVAVRMFALSGIFAHSVESWRQFCRHLRLALSCSWEYAAKFCLSAAMTATAQARPDQFWRPASPRDSSILAVIRMLTRLW
jgi:hypothetical protein